MDDQRIITLFFNRNEEAISQTEKKYGPYCRTISSNILNNPQDVEECVNDTYFQTWNSIPPTKPNSLKAYLAKIVRNISLNKYKSKHTQKRKDDSFAVAYEELENIIPSVQAIDDHLCGIHLQELIEKFLESQNKEYQKIFIARYWYFESIHDISTKLNISESKTKMVLLRMRNSLKTLLEQEDIQI